MGKACCGAKQQIVYNHNGKQQTIPVKQAETLDKFA